MDRGPSWRRAWKGGTKGVIALRASRPTAWRHCDELDGFGSGSTVHHPLPTRWVEQDVWEAMWRLLFQYYNHPESLEQAGPGPAICRPQQQGRSGVDVDRTVLFLHR